MSRLSTIQLVSILLGSLLTVSLVFFLTRPAIPQSTTEQARPAVERWLLGNCSVEEADSLEKQLRAFDTQLEPAFLEAFEKGPNTSLISEVEQAAAKRFDQRQALLKSGSVAGLSKEDIDAARSVSREQFIAQAKQDFVTRYKSQALLGLGIVGSDKAQEVLQQVARDEKSPLRGSAQEGLKKMQIYKKPGAPTKPE